MLTKRGPGALHYMQRAASSGVWCDPGEYVIMTQYGKICIG